MQVKDSTITTTWLGDAFRSVVASAFDRPPIAWKHKDHSGIHPVQRLCSTGVAGPHNLRPPLNRNAFLAGCHHFTADALVEHLIVGLGHKHGPTVRVHSLLHWVGEPTSIAVPYGLREQMTSYVAAGRENRVIVFHNHPRNGLDAVLDPDPIASIADRATMLRWLMDPVVATKSLLQGRQFQWFVGQNGFVREFTTPDIIGLWARCTGAAERS